MAYAVKNKDHALTPALAAFRKAVALYEGGKLQESIEFYKQCLIHDIKYAPGWVNMAVALRRLGNYEVAALCLKRAIELTPENHSALTNYGNCLADLGRPDEALVAQAEALRLKPDDFLIRNNYAVALRESGRFEEALAYFQSMLKDRPNDTQTQWEAALLNLKLENWKEGWKGFEVRWGISPKKPRSSETGPQWRGEDIKDKTLLVYEEQGFGDSIICSRFIPLVAARGGKVILECKKPLHRLFSSIPGIVKLVEPEQTTSGFDYHIPMMSLPGIFETTLSNLPAPAPLTAATSLPPKVAQALALGKGRMKIGIVWSGSVTFSYNHKRAVDISRFLPFAEVPGIQLYSLQKGPREHELRTSGADAIIHEIGPHMEDFSMTAAVLQELDLIIMTDSSVAHLAGSLGRPVWNILSFAPYWLYLRDRSDSPWYQSMRLFRQKSPGDWDGVFAEVLAELKKTAALHKSAPADSI